ncbi:hydrolase [uncultured Clostridium sp.]|uniref:hydrolase n=1 Tax=uncultured Clostridium sp. TaxID=59620 RepID=UPI0025D34309|nr:hydrolase [uncultured Clostridium sp.]
MNTNKKSKFIPEITGALRKRVVEVPQIIRECSGIKIFGKRIKSLLFSTDVAIIKNSDADAIIAVYPFTPQPIITQALVSTADVPVFCGVGGGTTQGKRVVNLALDAEFKGAMGVVVNAPTSNEIIEKIRDTIDIPVIVTVISEDEDIKKRIESGATILNVSGGKNTAKIVRNIRKMYPEFPIIATGGPTDETIKETIEAGANAITFTPPTSASIMGDLMDVYRSR